MQFDQFRFHHNSRLADYATNYVGKLSDSELRKLRNRHWDQIEILQEQLFAESKQSLLIVLQAMDAAGKDSTIAKLTKNMNAQGCLVHSFKKPSKKEMAHDFLWRVHSKVPAQGEITLFNRSHYEDVLIVKVHGWANDQQISDRYDNIIAFEKLLADRGTKVIKFMLNVSPEYQLQRFRSRLKNPEKNWKFNPGDLEERKHWDQYMNAFEIAMQKTSLDSAPWYVVPAENRRFRDAMISGLVMQTLLDMKPSFPAPEFDTQLYRADSID